jgi:hypothetical protein
MGDGDGMVLRQIEPTPDTIDQLDDGFASMRGSCGISQPRSESLGIRRLKFIEASSMPRAIVAITQIVVGGR